MRIVYANSRYAVFSGVESIETGIDYSDWLRSSLVRSGVDQKTANEQFHASLRMIQSAPNSWEETISDGRTFLMNVRATREGGTVLIATEITSLKRTEQLLEERATAINLAHDAIAITDTNGCFTYMNPSHLQLFGYTDEAQVLGRPWSTIYGPNELARIEREGVPVLMSEGSWRAEIDGRRRDGSIVKQEVSLTFVGGIGIICVTRDISARLADRREREGLREQLYRAQRQEAVGQLAAGISHDFNNILAAINGSANLILTADDAGDKTRMDADRILRAGQRGEAMISRLLDFGKSGSSVALTDLSQTLGEVAEMVSDIVPENIKLSLEMPGDAVRLVTDQTAVVQIVMNLTLNARDAINATDGRISITLSHECPEEVGQTLEGSFDQADNSVFIVVADNGFGMSQDKISRIMDPYFSTKGDKGTGLGLAVVRRLVQELGGALSVQSHPGSGSKFTVLIPTSLEPIRKPPVESIVSRVTNIALKGCAILIVDDDQDVAEVMARVLEMQGAEVSVVEDPSEALAAISDDPGAWKLLITDLTMPKMTGDELAEAVHRVSPDLPIILCSAFEQARRRGLSAKYTAILAKPVPPGELVETASRAILTLN